MAFSPNDIGDVSMGGPEGVSLPDLLNWPGKRYAGKPVTEGETHIQSTRGSPSNHHNSTSHNQVDSQCAARAQARVQRSWKSQGEAVPRLGVASWQ